MNILALTLAALIAAQSPQSEAEGLRKELDKVKADYAASQRLLEAKIQELNDRLAKTQNEKKLVTTEQTYSRQLAERLAKDLQALEEKHVEMARDKEKVKATIPVVPVTPAPAPAPVYYHYTLPQGKITAIANEIDLVILSIGSEQGVTAGQTFTITRGSESIGTVTIDRVDGKWSVGKVSKKKGDPLVGDIVLVKKEAAQAPATPSYWIAPNATVLSRSSADELRTIRKELDEVRSQVRQLSDRIVPSWQGQGVSVEETPEELRAHLSILRGLLVRRVREGSPAEKAGLKVNDVVPDLLEAQLLQAIEMGMPIHVIRQGQRVRLPGATGR